MSLIATNPFALATWAPSLTMPQKRQSSRCDGNDALLADCGCPHAHELADAADDEERRVVVAVSAAGPVDEDDVLIAQLRAPAAPLQLVRQRAQPRTPLLLRG